MDKISIIIPVKDEEETIGSVIKATIDFTKATLTADGKEYRVSSVGAAAQELIVVGGLESWVKKKIEE